jgi:hypothetical protein
MSALSSFSTARTSEAQAARSKVSRHLPVSLYVTGVPGLGIAIAARTWTAPREAEAGVTLPVTAERRRTTLEKRAGASATGAARVMAAMISLKLGEGGSATRECDGALAVRKVWRACEPRRVHPIATCPLRPWKRADRHREFRRVTNPGGVQRTVLTGKDFSKASELEAHKPNTTPDVLFDWSARSGRNRE